MDSILPSEDSPLKVSFVSAALRTARDLDAGEAEWREFIEKLKKGKSD